LVGRRSESGLAVVVVVEGGGDEGSLPFVLVLLVLRDVRADYGPGDRLFGPGDGAAVGVSRVVGAVEKDAVMVVVVVAVAVRVRYVPVRGHELVSIRLRVVLPLPFVPFSLGSSGGPDVGGRVGAVNR